MGDEHRGSVCRLQDVAHFRGELFAQIDVQVRERLVHQQQTRLRCQRTGQRHTLLLSARQLVREALRLGPQADHVEQPLHASLVIGAATRSESDIALDAQVREQRIVLKHHADAALLGRQVAARTADLLARDSDVTAGQGLKATDAAQHGCLAAA